ncbi:MAG: class I SAM-dependent methyltransferase [Pseudomonadota bacterium]
MARTRAERARKRPDERGARARPKRAAQREPTPPANVEVAPVAGVTDAPLDITDLGYAADLGARAHYEDPGYYTRTYGTRRHDIDYYVRRARASKGPVLEYGVGNGRIALHVARAGVSIEGIDLSQAMLDDFRARLAREPKTVRQRVQLHRGDMRTMTLGRRFPLVTAPFNAVLHLYQRQDLEAFLARVREHLAPGGLFVFDFSIPVPGDLARDPERSFPAGTMIDPRTNERLQYAERFEYDPLRQLLLVRMELSSEDGRTRTIPLTHRQYFPREMEALLHYNGFEQILFTADFTDQPLDRYVDSIVVEARARAVPGGG